MPTTKRIDGVLLPKYRERGFTIRETDDHTVLLCWYGIIQSVFTAYTTAAQLNNECERLLNAS